MTPNSIQEVLGAIIAFLLACGLIVGTFQLLGGLIRSSTLVIDRVLWLLGWMLRPFRRRWTVPYLSQISFGSQFLIGIAFFYYFIYQVENQQTRLSSLERLWLFSFLVLLLPVGSGIIAWRAAEYREHFSRILFYHRFIKPIWDWVTYQSYSLLWLQHVPMLYPVIGALDDVAARVNHRQWQTFLRCLFFLSLFTLPVTMLPDSVYTWLAKIFETFPGSADLRSHVQQLPWVQGVLQTPWFREPLAILGKVYLYLFDWAATVVGLYLVVAALAPLEPRNLFQGVAEALQYFVRDRGIFVFTGYFWHSGTNEHVATKRVSEGEDTPAPWEELALTLHRATVELDKSMPSTWQGINNRVMLVLEEESEPDGKSPTAHCLHYRRFGETAFVVAVDSEARRFNGGNTRSQAYFLQLAESIGSLVNIRHSLKYSTVQSGGKVFWR